MKQRHSQVYIVLAFIAGGIVMNVSGTLAQTAVIDQKSILQEIGIATTLTTISNAITTLNNAIGDGVFGSVQTLLQQGFTQISNYLKAAVGAHQQIADASNTAMARFHRDVRNAQIRDEHTASPTHCTALDGGVAKQAAAVQAFAVTQAMTTIHDQRGQSAPGMPSYNGRGQAAAAITAAHLAAYCNADEAAAGLCIAPSPIPNADQQASTFIGVGLYPDQTSVNAAKDYGVTLIQPIAPAALRGDQLTSTSGQEAAVARRSYNARMSLAMTWIDRVIGMQIPSIPLTTLQRQYLTNMGITVPASGNSSFLQILQVEAQRRVSDISWHAALQQMPPAAVNREIALELALLNDLQWQNLYTNIMGATLSATQLAADTDRHFQPTVPVPTPSIARN